MTERPQASGTLDKQAAQHLRFLRRHYTAWTAYANVTEDAFIDPRGQKPWARKRKPRGWNKTWPVIVNQGTIGAIAILLNQGPPTVFWQFVAWSRARGLKHMGESIHNLRKAPLLRYSGAAEDPGASLFRDAYWPDIAATFKLGGWKLVQLQLLIDLRVRAGRFEGDVLMSALFESLVFERFGFVISRCQHGDHWYVSDDKRRKDCVVHRLAGQQARWRDKHPKWKLSVKSRARKKASAQRKPRPRSRV